MRCHPPSHTPVCRRRRPSLMAKIRANPKPILNLIDYKQLA